jgi:hypothetical protein
MRHALFTLAALLAGGMLFLGISGGVIAQGTPQPMPGMAGESHPAHIHNGSCANLGDVVAPLSNVSAQALNNGTPTAMEGQMMGSASAIPVLSSVTTVDMSLSDILNGEHAVNVHESAENIGTYVACGDIGGTMIGQTDLLFGMAPLNNSGLSGVASLHDNGDGTTTVYVYLTMDVMSMGGGGMATPMASPAS